MWLVLKRLEPGLYGGQDLLFDLRLPQLCWGWGLLHNCWSRSPEVCVWWNFIALECVPCPKGGDCWCKWGLCGHTEPMHCLGRNLQFLSDSVQCCVPFSVVFIPDLVVGSLAEWAVAGGCGAVTAGSGWLCCCLGCLCGTPLPGPVHPSSSSKLRCGVGRVWSTPTGRWTTACCCPGPFHRTSMPSHCAFLWYHLVCSLTKCATAGPTPPCVHWQWAPWFSLDHNPGRQGCLHCLHAGKWTPLPHPVCPRFST